MRSLKVVLLHLVLLASFANAQTASGSSPTPKLVSQRPVKIDFARREAAAPTAIKERLASLRSEIARQQLTFRVGYTTAMDEPLERLAGTRAPADLSEAAARQNELAGRMLAIEREALDSLHVARPDLKIPDLSVFLACVASRRSFDWRTRGDVTPVRNQDGCGSCWAFGALGAYEGSYALRNKTLSDVAEQDILSCSGAGSCGGGWHAGVFDYLIKTGSSGETSDPYTATDAPCPTGLSRFYRAVTWGYVHAGGGIPTVDEMKQALCDHGPLTVALYASPAFQAYTDGVFNEKLTDHGINHDVTLIGWNDDKHAWLIKNSWGTGWGSACGYGTSKGYMWIDYESNNVGYGAAWVQAKSWLIKLPDRYFAMRPEILPMPPERIPSRRGVTKTAGR